MNITAFETLCKLSETFADIVMENEESFMNTFCHEADELIGVSFYESGVQYTYILGSGQLVVNSCSSAMFREWLKEVL